jgi:hypothetical protein
MTGSLLTTGLAVALSTLAPSEAPDPSQLPAIEMIVVRIDAGGKPAYACVGSPEDAKRFLNAPKENVAREAKEK